MRHAMRLPRTDRPIGILVAVEEELRPLLRRCSDIRVERASGARIHRGTMAGRSVCLAKSGLGSERAELAVSALIEQADPGLLLIAGFAGSLATQVLPGDLVVASAVESLGAPACLTPDSCLRQAAEAVSLPGVRGHSAPLISGQGVQESAGGKRAVADANPAAAALDMESAGAAAAAQRCGVPWVVVRAITDGLGDDMPLPFDRFVANDGEMDRARILAAVLARPWKVPGLIRLGARSACAAGNLAAFVEAYVRALASLT